MTCLHVYSTETLNEPVISLRVRHALDKPTLPYILRYVSKPEINESNPTAIRTCIDVAVTNNVVEFITMMGFRMDYDFIARGYMFKKGAIKVSVIKIFKLKYTKKCCEPNLETLTRSYLVEASIMAPTGQVVEAEEIRLFAEKLRPIVHLEKIDLARI
jgi:mediator of RNA polymerase II transcription subunit 18